MKNSLRHTKKRFTVILFVMLIVEMFSSAVVVSAASFAPELVQVSGNRPITQSGYLNCQGVAFDIYTKQDGYSFARGTEGNESKFKIIHFKMNSSGKITQKGSVTYKAANLGHANDGTIFRFNNKKYMFVAISGGTEKYSTTFAGNKTKVGMIRMEEYDKGIARLRGVSVKCKDGVKMSNPIADCKFSGITYTGYREVDDVSRPVFVLKDGRTFYAAYFTINKETQAVTLTIFDSARVNKPTFTYNGTTYDSSTQGITYHNGYIYIPYSGEGNKAVNQNMMIARISYTELFKGSFSEIKNMQVFSKRVESATVNGKKVKLAKNFPEAIFFRTLNSSDNMYVSFNRGTYASKASDIDCVMRSKQKY